MMFRLVKPIKRRAVAGWAIIVVMLGLIIFGFLAIEIDYAATQVNTFISSQPSFTAAYDPSTNSAMDALLLGGGLAIMVMFGAVAEIINRTQKRTSGEEVI